MSVFESDMSRKLQRNFSGNVAHLDTVDQGGATADCRGNMDCLCHFIDIRALFQAVLGIGVYAVGALDGMRHGQGDKGFFPLGQLALGKNGSIVVKEFFGQLRGPFGYFGKLRQVLGVVITACYIGGRYFSVYSERCKITSVSLGNAAPRSGRVFM